MTKNKAKDLARRLDIACDEPYLFAVKIGAGSLHSVKTNHDLAGLLTLLLAILDSVFNNLKKFHHEKFREMLCLKLTQYLLDDAPIAREENLSGKQLAKRIKHNDSILDSLEKVL